MDEALGLPTERTAQVALRTQQILAHESGVAEVADPLGGSYMIESLTDDIVRRARDYVQRIDAMGGAMAALEKGFQQHEIADAAYAFQQDVEAGREQVVGVNVFRLANEPPITVLSIDPEAERAQVERLQAFKQSRDGDGVLAARSALETAASEDRQLMPPILQCVRAGATLGEIADTLRSVFGEYTDQGFD